VEEVTPSRAVETEHDIRAGMGNRDGLSDPPDRNSLDGRDVFMPTTE
jgi:hypothetical protein